MADMDKHDRIVWIDLEMTGLDIHEHTIVEASARGVAEGVASEP